MRRGFLGSMEIQIPWNRLHTDSVVITIDDVYVLAETSGQLDESSLHKEKMFLLEKIYSQLRNVKLENVEFLDAKILTNEKLI